MPLLRQISRLLKSIPLRLVLVIPFVILVSGTVFLTSLLSFLNQRQAVADLADQLLAETSLRIEENLERFFAQLDRTSQPFPAALGRESADYLKNLHARRPGLSYIVDHAGLLLAASTTESGPPALAAGSIPQNMAAQSANHYIRASYRCLTTNRQETPSSAPEQSQHCDDAGERLFVRASRFNGQPGLDWRVVVVAPEKAFTTEIRQNYLNTLALCLVALLLSIASGLLVARWVARPISLMNQASRDLVAGREVSGLPTDRGDELGGLACNFAQMAASLQQSLADLKDELAERQRAEEQLVQAQKMESVGRLAGGIAHDFNNMLGVIIGHCQMGLVSTAADQPIHQTLQKIQLAAERSADLTRQLLAFARRQTITPRVLDLNQTLDTMLDMLKRLIGEDIDLLWHPRAELWPVKIDPAQVDQLLANLCVNARDAIAGVGKITIETGNITFDRAYCAAHPGFRPGEYAMLAVSDDGHGMSKEVIERIFEPFFTTKEMNEGTGLGLAMVYGIVKQNHGFINVYSEPGKGSTFRIYLPRFVGEPEELEPPTPAEIPLGSGELVLLVEDEAMILDMTREMLESLGYRVIPAASPQEALTQVHQAEQLQLLISDVVMPEMNGRDLAREIHAIKPEIGALFISGYTANVIAHHGVLEPGVHFLQKPFSREALAHAVHQALHQQ